MSEDRPAAARSRQSTGARQQLRRFIGVSLGGGRGKTTAIARLELSAAPEDSSGESELRGQLTLAEARARWT